MTLAALLVPTAKKKAGSHGFVVPEVEALGPQSEGSVPEGDMTHGGFFTKVHIAVCFLKHSCNYST